MSAWPVFVRHDVRRRWHHVALLALFVAVSGGVVLSAIVGARRDATAVDRLTARTHPATVGVLPNEPGFDWAPVAALPEVRAMQLFAVAYYGVADRPQAEPDFPPVGPPVGDPIELQVPLAGRLAEPARVDEVTISPALHDTGVDIGDDLTLEMPAREVLEALTVGHQPPDVPPIEALVHVVGIAKGTFFGGDVHPTAAFYDRFHDVLTPPGLGYVNAVVRLEDGPTAIATFQADLDRIAGRPVEALDFTRYIAEVRTATQVEAGALVAFAAAAAAVTLVLGGIAVARAAAASSGALATLRSLGFTRRDALVAGAAVPVIGVAAGSAGAAAVAYRLSSFYPIGQGRFTEPAPGLHANVAVLAAGSGLLLVVGTAGALLATWAASRDGHTVVDSSAGRSAAGLQLGRGPVPVWIGARLAVRRGGAGGRAVTAALLAGVIGIAAAITFGAGLSRGVSDGRLSGQAFDSLSIRVGAADLPADLVAAWREDDRVATAVRIMDTVAEIDDESVAVFAITDLKGRFHDAPLHGRVPVDDDEVAFGPRDMGRLGLAIGDQVRLADGTMLRVVGEVFAPELSHTNYDEGARVTPARLASLVGAGDPVKFDVLAIERAAGVPPDQVDELWHGYAADVGGLVDAQRNLRPTRALPNLFAGFVAVLGVGASAYALLACVRRRRREVAILSTLGLTRRQARACVAWQVAASVAIAVLAGGPIGFALGRTLWQLVADTLPLRYATPVATLGLVGLGIGALVAGAVVAVAPIARTARDEPAGLLRAE